ncbi:PTI1-like tyrosine-protein kinase 2 isoform X5 [Capsella rubella]|uniref:PTI1-like tyrosine-protein kinase 2 isoform X5 n=1 Tax=Capsella rubella TaxID=81985 RepID=UPI000CD4F0F9|nr:PTI1-like tyrosine-protein kinase 2 isoform X5 [Capsella rubella]
MAMVKTSAYNLDLRPSSQLLNSECKYDESSVKKSKELLKMTGEEKRKISGRSISLPSIDIFLDEKPGWPFLKTATLETPKVHRRHTRKISVVNWVMSLPERFPNHHQQNLNYETSFVKKQLKEILRDSKKWFNYNVLKKATSNFSQENLIGKGGCSKVYRGILEDGKGIAVKILKSSSNKDATTDFVHEINIISSLSHQNISGLLGVCVQNNDLISVYSLSSVGSLEETLHGKQKGKHVLSWKHRFKIAIGLAEALDYLHNQCSKPVIHRDVKTSNVLLSDELQPQILDCRCGDLRHLLDIRYKLMWWALLDTLHQSISCTEKSVIKSMFTPLEWFCLNSYQEEILFRLRILEDKRVWSCKTVD